MPGETLEVWGPLGNGFPPDAGRSSADGGRRDRPNAVCGLGQGISWRLQRYRRIRRATVSAPKKSRSATAQDRRTIWPAWTISASVGVEVRLSTDDGSAGHRGLVTELIEPAVVADNRVPAASSVAGRSR